MKLKLTNGGNLYRQDWNSETEKYDLHDITEKAVYYLNHHVELEGNVILKDLFLLINKNLTEFTPVFNNWIEEFTFDALNKQPDTSDSVDFVQLFWDMTIEDDELLDIPAFPNFEGIGIAKEGDEHHTPGEIINWGMSFTPIQDFVHVPLRLKDTITVYKESHKNNKYSCDVTTYKTSAYTLFQIIQGIIWGMSFYGGPEQAQEKKNELNEQIRGIESGETELYPLEDLFNEESPD
jgi:hypothetical protein